jgi:hypothetical protein
LDAQGSSLGVEHHAFDTLSRAWVATRDPKYAKAYACLMREWIVACPVSSNDSRGPWHRLRQYQRVERWCEAMNRLMGALEIDTNLT